MYIYFYLYIYFFHIISIINTIIFVIKLVNLNSKVEISKNIKVKVSKCQSFCFVDVFFQGFC